MQLTIPVNIIRLGINGAYGMIKVIIVEDNKVIREGLTAMFNATDGLNCVANYKTCEDMLDHLKQDNPDLILMDIGLPGMSGIEGTKKVKKILPDILILVLSIYEDDDNIFEALCAGACGYLIKKTPPARLIEAIHEAYAGGSPMSANIARKVVNYFQTTIKQSEKSEVSLSEREINILTSLSKGNSYKRIAKSEYISLDTVRYHIRNIYKKLHVHSQSEAVTKALRKGWI
jgi:DNA-binding NarL/FixJ family response regulator